VVGHLVPHIWLVWVGVLVLLLGGFLVGDDPFDGGQRVGV
jgi:hypothetical protein